MQGTSSGRRRVFREPGFWANFAVLFGWTTSLIHDVIWQSINQGAMGTVKDLLLSDPVGYYWPMILMAWCGLALSGRWKSQATWTDRSGRILGVFWITRYFLDCGHEYWMRHLSGNIARSFMPRTATTPPFVTPVATGHELSIWDFLR